MIRRSESMAIAAMLVIGGFGATAAPYMPIAPDLFDHLATTFPIPDWIMHARNTYDSWESRRPNEHPMIEYRVRNCIELRAEYTVDRSVSSMCVRESLDPSQRFLVVPDPCKPGIVAFEAGETLPDRPGVAGLFSGRASVFLDVMISE